MDKKIIAIIAVVIIAIVAVGLYIVGSSEVTLEGMDASVKLPSNYTVDKSGVATAGDINVRIIGSTDTPDVVLSFMGAVAARGDDAGYKDYKNGTIGNYTYYEFTAVPGELKNITTDRQTTSEGEMWMEYPPQMVLGILGNTSNVEKLRDVIFIDKNTNKTTTLLIYSNNTNADLHTPEIDKIVNSIAPIKK